jgi:hypothetical protein
MEEAFRREETRLHSKLLAMMSLGSVMDDENTPVCPEYLLDYKLKFSQELVTRTVKQWPDLFLRLARRAYTDEGPMPDDLLLWNIAATVATARRSHLFILFSSETAKEVFAEFSEWFVVKQRAEVAALAALHPETPASVKVPELDVLYTLTGMSCVKPVVDSGLFCRQAIARLEQGRARALAADSFDISQGAEPKLCRTSIYLNPDSNAIFMTDVTKKISFCGVLSSSSFMMIMCEGNLCCSHCGLVLCAKTMSKCSRCRCAVYCLAACQKADWGRHSEWCKAASLLPEGIEVGGKVVAIQMPEVTMEDFVEGPPGFLNKKTAEVVNKKGRSLGFWDGHAIVNNNAAKQLLSFLPPSRKAMKRFSQATKNEMLDDEDEVSGSKGPPSLSSSSVVVEQAAVEPKMLTTTSSQKDLGRHAIAEDKISKINREAHERRRERRRGLVAELVVQQPQAVVAGAKLAKTTKDIISTNEEVGLIPNRRLRRKQRRVAIKLCINRQREAENAAADRAAFIRQMPLKVIDGSLRDNCINIVDIETQQKKTSRRSRTYGHQCSHVDPELSLVLSVPRL